MKWETKNRREPATTLELVVLLDEAITLGLDALSAGGISKAVTLDNWSKMSATQAMLLFLVERGMAARSRLLYLTETNGSANGPLLLRTLRHSPFGAQLIMETYHLIILIADKVLEEPQATE
jgi:hypothetical protein